MEDSELDHYEDHWIEPEKPKPFKPSNGKSKPMGYSVEGVNRQPCTIYQHFGYMEHTRYIETDRIKIAEGVDPMKLHKFFESQR